jgi:hypothetical protein
VYRAGHAMETVCAGREFELSLWLIVLICASAVDMWDPYTRKHQGYMCQKKIFMSFFEKITMPHVSF